MTVGVMTRRGPSKVTTTSRRPMNANALGRTTRKQMERTSEVGVDSSCSDPGRVYVVGCEGWLRKAFKVAHPRVL